VPKAPKHFIFTKTNWKNFWGDAVPWWEKSTPPHTSFLKCPFPHIQMLGTPLPLSRIDENKLAAAFLLEMLATN